jgi:hypothetical protein
LLAGFVLPALAALLSALSGLLLLLAGLLLAAAALLLAGLVLTTLLLAGILLVRIVHDRSYLHLSLVFPRDEQRYDIAEPSSNHFVADCFGANLAASV